MIVKKTSIDGCFALFTQIRKDNRGCFVKVFQEKYFAENGLETHYREEYYTRSTRRVLRGLHFQIPPRDLTKVVYCVAGEVFDVVVDLRVGSRTYGCFESFTLNAEKGQMIYIPRGLAHGFYTVSREAILQYKVTESYSPEHDTGILWDSVKIPWPDDNPLISERDKTFAPLARFQSPFVLRDVPR